MREDSCIRPFEPADLTSVAALYERVVRSGRAHASAALQAAFHSLFVASPLVSRDVPPLVIESSAGVQGFQGVHVRTTTSGDTVASLGPLFVTPEARIKGSGLLLLGRILEGKQQLTYSDGASEEARRLWQRLGGHCSDAHSLEWALPIKPLTTLVRNAARGRNPRFAKILQALGPIAGQADRWLQTRWNKKLQGVSRAPVELSEISPDEWLNFLFDQSSAHRLAPILTEESAHWTLDQLRSLRSRGAFVLLGAKRRQTLLGTLVGYRSAEGILSIMQLRCQERHCSQMLSALARLGREQGLAAIEGRLDATVQGGLGDFPVLLRRSTPFLVHSHNPALVDRFLGTRSSFSRIDGEWIMNLRSEAYA
jgi:hypothetical protein